MDAKETVKQGLQARKDVRAAEARAAKLQEEADAHRDARFYDQIGWKAQRAALRREQEILAGVVNRQRVTILQLKEDKAVLLQRERMARQQRNLLSIVKAAATFFLTICAMNLDWIVPNLAASLLIGSAFCLLSAVVKMARNK